MREPFFSALLNLIMIEAGYCFDLLLDCLCSARRTVQATLNLTSRSRVCIDGVLLSNGCTPNVGLLLCRTTHRMIHTTSVKC